MRRKDIILFMKILARVRVRVRARAKVKTCVIVKLYHFKFYEHNGNYYSNPKKSEKSKSNC